MLSALKQVFGRVSRPRGDGPGSGCQASRMCRVSPPARGWSVRAEHDRPDRRGFPARSGMVPDLHRTTRFQSRFPRPRGDGPISRMPVSAKIRVSPPARHLPDEGKFAINCKSDSSGGPSSFTTPWRRGKADPNRAVNVFRRFPGAAQVRAREAGHHTDTRTPSRSASLRGGVPSVARPRPPGALSSRQTITIEPSPVATCQSETTDHMRSRTRLVISAAA